MIAEGINAGIKPVQDGSESLRIKYEVKLIVKLGFWVVPVSTNDHR